MATMSLFSAGGFVKSDDGSSQFSSASTTVLLKETGGGKNDLSLLWRE